MSQFDVREETMTVITFVWDGTKEDATHIAAAIGHDAPDAWLAAAHYRRSLNDGESLELTVYGLERMSLSLRAGEGATLVLDANGIPVGFHPDHRMAPTVVVQEGARGSISA